MIRVAFPALAVAAVVLTGGSVHAQDSRFAIGVQGGTPGLGANVQFSLNDYIVLRGSYDWLAVDRDDTYDGIPYEGEADFNSPGAFVDLHPFGNAFFVSGGAYFGDRSVSLDSTPTEPTEIGGVTFTPEEIGTLKGEIELAEAVPFVGIGFDNTFSSGGRWGWRAMAGAAFNNDPQVGLFAGGGSLTDTDVFQQELAEEELQIQEEADDYDILPVLQVGLNYRF